MVWEAGASMVAGSLSAFKSALDIAKTLMNLRDEVQRNAAVIDLQRQILAAQEDQTTLLEEKRTLEAEVANLKAWDTEKEQYELKAIAPTAYAFVPKPHTEIAEPPRWLCTTCYHNAKKSILNVTSKSGRYAIWACATCNATLMVDASYSPIYPWEPA